MKAASLPRSLALDVGGTKILAAVIDAGGTVVAQTERATEAVRGRTAVLANMALALAPLQLAYPEVLGLGISAAGVVDRVQGRVIDATEAMPGWAGTDLRGHFEALLGLPVQALNDVHAALGGELAWGGLANAAPTTAVMLTLGTGLGGAVAVKGKVLAGRHGLAGHFGRSKLLHGGQWRAVESLVSGTGLANLYRELGGELAAGAGALAVLAEPDRPLAQAALSLWVEHLAAQLHNLYWTLDPDVVLLGGGMLGAKDLWWPQLMAALAPVPLRVIPAALGNTAGVFGAAKALFEGLEIDTEARLQP